MYYWFGMSFVWWIFWAAVIVAFFVFLTPVPRGRAVRPPDDPLEILARRYAAGEITTAEYDLRRARLLERVPRATSAATGAGLEPRPVPPARPPGEVGRPIEH